MDDSEDNLSSEDFKPTDNPSNVKTKPKKRSLIERELETSLTARITSPVTYADGTSTSRYGRARRLKSVLDQPDVKKVTAELKSPLVEKSPLKTQSQSPVYKMHASNSPHKRSGSPKKIGVEKYLDDQIECIYQENMSLSRFSNEESSAITPSPAKKFPKVYIRKDLIQKREPEDTVMVIQNMFSPVKSAKKSTNTHLKNILERSSERYSLNKPQNGYLDNTSVVKTLDFDGKKRKSETKDKGLPSKSELFEMEAKCAYQVGDLAWARMGTYPFWPSIVTRDPASGIFVKKKLFGRMERDVIHVTFFGDNGRRGWIVDTMLRKYLGQLEFEAARENFTPEAKKKDPRLYAAFFVSEKKQALWNTSVEEAEMLMREPKRLRIDIFLDMLEKSRTNKGKQPKSKISRTDSDVSLSESLYDSLFSEDDGKSDSNDRSRNRSKNKSLDMFEVVTACLDNMAAKTGITKIQRQSHMDRWLQKAKSKTPEKTKAKSQVPSKKLEDKKETNINSAKRKKIVSTKRPVQRSYSLRKNNESLDSQSHKNEQNHNKSSQDDNVKGSDHISTDTDSCKHLRSTEINGIGIISKVESIAEKANDSEKEEETFLNETTSDSPKESSEDNMHLTYDSETYTDDENQDGSLSNAGKNNTNDDEQSISQEPTSALTFESIDSKKISEPELLSIANKGFEIDSGPKTENNIELKNSTVSVQHIDCQGKLKETSHQILESVTGNVINEDISAPSVFWSGINSKNENTIDSKDSTENNLSKEPSIETEDDIVNTEVHERSTETDSISKDTVNITEDDKEITESAHLEQNVNNTTDIHAHKADPDIDVNDADMSIDDDDSDSERLPYSPLSNLGNNSDDNLSLDDVPFPVEFENQEGGKQDIHEIVNGDDINRNDKLNIDVSNKAIEDNEQNRTIKHNLTQQSIETHNKVSEIILKNGHIMSDENYFLEKEKHINNKNKNKIVDNRNHTTEFQDKNDILNNTENTIGNGYRSEHVREIEMAAKEVRICVSEGLKDALKMNGFHGVNGDFDLETASIHSEDSVTSTRSGKRKLRGKQENRHDNPLENLEFVKYMELRQDSIMEENPELDEKEIIAYLYKTWQYEESVKSDDKINDDLRASNLVKGLNQSQPEPPSRPKKKLSLSKHEPSKKNTLERFLRNRRDVEIKNDGESDEVCMLRKRGIRKNMIKYDDDDDTSTDQERNRDSPRILRKRVDLTEESKKSIENENLSHAELTKNPVEKISPKDIEKTEVDVDLKKAEKPGSQLDSTEQLTSSTYKSKENLTNTDQETENKKDITSEKSDSVEGTQTIEQGKSKDDFDGDSLDSEDSETPLIRCKLRSKAKNKENDVKEGSHDIKNKDEDADTISVNSEESEKLVNKRKKRFGSKKIENAMEDPEFVKYLELRQDALIDENPELGHDEIVAYLYQTWLYEEEKKSEIKKSDEIEQSTLVKGLKDVQQPKKIRRKLPKTEISEKETGDGDMLLKDKPKRKSVKPFYNEEYSDIEEELEVFEIFKPKNKVIPKVEPGQSVSSIHPESEQMQEVVEVYDEVELYFAELTKPKPNIFKGLIREKVCEICEKVGSLVKCKVCNGMFHVDCVKKQVEITEVPAPTRGRKKKKKTGRKPKNSDEFDHDDKSQDVSEENNASVEEILETDSHTVDADVLEAQLSAKMKEILDTAETVEYDSYSSDDGLDWSETVPGKCEIIDIKLKPRHSISEIDYSDFKCNNCQKYSTPICFVCKGAVSKKESTKRQKCHVAHCHKYYHIECLDHWPQTQFNGGEPSKNNKKINEYFEALTCPRHVCHTCVSDDPRGCKTRFSGDKLARCVRCPATYHSFTKCVPAGTQILTASHIICPRHYEHRPGKVPCHVNTGWCFLCALGGSLICCEYCPTSFHAECLNIDPPEGGYMCEDCETGRLPLYGEMVWVKLGHYRWWPGIILHPYEIPENLLAVKHSLGEFVVRFFGQYDHYWVNRGRVFPFQEGDSGRISSQKSKIDAAFTTAMEHAQRACQILKTAQPNEEESLDIASSLLPPHYVKLKVNKPCGSLCGRKLEDPESSLTQCECNPLDDDPCGPYSQCLNRMLLTECGPTCRAGERCNNRAFEKRLYPKLTPYRTPSRGWGLKTLEDIKAGQFVIEYVGELIDEEEFRRRMRRKHEIRDENFYFLTLDKERMIDAGPKGNLARFMNHCCEPNCETQKWTVLGDVRVGLFALYDIPAHSEVTFNYNLECAGIDKKRCMCGAKRCSGYIGAKPKQDDSSKKNKLQPIKRAYKKRKPEESPSTKNKPKRPIGRPPKPRELTEIEKDLLIIRNATNGLSSDESSRSLSSEFERNPKALKRKRVSFSTEEVIVYDGTESPNVKKTKLEDKIEGE